MNRLPEALAERFYNELQVLVFGRIHFSKTSLVPKNWSGLPERDRLEWTEAARRVLADEQLMKTIRERAEGL